MEASLSMELNTEELTNKSDHVAGVVPSSPLPQVESLDAHTNRDGSQNSDKLNKTAIDFFKDGMALLRGIGTHQDFSMAAARLLDSADFNHPPALFYCSLLYFAGVGVSRNTKTASEYAGRYLDIEPEGQFAEIAKAVINGTLGTENARKLLTERPNAMPSEAKAKQISKKPIYLFMAVLIPALAAGSFYFYSKSKDVSSLGPSDISGIKLESLLSKDEVNEASKQALLIAATLQTEAQSLMQQQAAADAAQAKAKEEQQAAMEAQAIAEQERKAAEEKKQKEEQQMADHAEAEKSAMTSNRIALMITSARQAARAGEFDRAMGILDGALAADPSNREALVLKKAIKQARSQAVNNLEIR